MSMAPNNYIYLKLNYSIIVRLVRVTSKSETIAR